MSEAEERDSDMDSRPTETESGFGFMTGNRSESDASDGPANFMASLTSEELVDMKEQTSGGSCEDDDTGDVIGRSRQMSDDSVQSSSGFGFLSGISEEVGDREGERGENTTLDLKEVEVERVEEDEDENEDEGSAFGFLKSPSGESLSSQTHSLPEVSPPPVPVNAVVTPLQGEETQPAVPVQEHHQVPQSQTAAPVAQEVKLASFSTVQPKVVS